MGQIILPYGVLCLLYPYRAVSDIQLYEFDIKHKISTVWRTTTFTNEIRCPFSLKYIVYSDILWYDTNKYYVYIRPFAVGMSKGYKCCVFKKKSVSDFLEFKSKPISLYSLWSTNRGKTIYDAYRSTVNLIENSDISNRF